MLKTTPKYVFVYCILDAGGRAGSPDLEIWALNLWADKFEAYGAVGCAAEDPLFGRLLSHLKL